MDLTSGGIARPLASSKGGADRGRVPVAAAFAFTVFRSWKGIGSRPSSFRWSRGLTANMSAINMHTIVTNKLSVVRKLGEVNAFSTASATKASAAIIQTMFSTLASLFMTVVPLTSLIPSTLNRPYSVSTTCGSGWVDQLAGLTHPLPQAVLTDDKLKFVGRQCFALPVGAGRSDISS